MTDIITNITPLIPVFAVAIGALIGGIFPLLLQRGNNTFTLRQQENSNTFTLTLEKFKRRREIIEEISYDLGAFHKNFNLFRESYYEFATDVMYLTKNKEQEVEYQKRLALLNKQFVDISLLMNKSYLINESNIARDIKQYVVAARQIQRLLTEGLGTSTKRPFDFELLDKYEKKYTATYEEILRNLSITYNK